MFTNKLKLNPDKTEFILIGSQKKLQTTPPSLSYQYFGKSGFASTKCQEPWSSVRLQFQFLKSCVTGHKVH